MAGQEALDVQHRIELTAGCLRLTLAPAIGGSIARFDRVEDGEVIPILRGCSASLSTPLDSACFPLVPFSNRIGGGKFAFRGQDVSLKPNMMGDPSPLHGQGWLAPWRVAVKRPTTAELVFLHQSGEWPWTYEARQIFTLDNGGLSAVLSCTNLSENPMPCGLGFHPYFPCTGTTQLDTRVEHVWTVDTKILPVERVIATEHYDISNGFICARSLDNGYDGWSGEAVISADNVPFVLRLSSPEAQFFQIYSPAEGGFFVAEPVSHANDALRAGEGEWGPLGLRVLASGESMMLSMRLDVEAI